MVLNGLGLITQALSLVPCFFQHKPTSRRMSPRVAPTQLNDDAIGWALETLYAYGVTARYRLVAATAAQRLGLAPRFAHLESTSVHVDGRDKSDEAPDAHVMHIPRGDSRDQRPDLNHVRLDWMVEHQAGMPVLMKPLSGNSRDVQDFGQLITAHLAQLPVTYGATCRVADSVLYRAEHLQKLAATRTQWITRVPATLNEAQAVLAQADPPPMAPLTAGYRAHVVRSSDGGVEQRWVLLHAAARQPQAQRAVDTQRLRHSEPARKTFKQLCRTAFVGAAEAQQALTTFAQGLQTTVVAQSTVRPISRDAKRGRPSQGIPPDQVVYPLDGALARRIAARQALLDQHRCVIRATHALDDTCFSPQELFAGDTGQAQAARGCRFLKDPPLLASSRSLNKPERIMALLMVMTICLLVYAALESRIRQALKAHEATVPDHKGQRMQNPTARWVFHSCVGIHL